MSPKYSNSHKKSVEDTSEKLLPRDTEVQCCSFMYGEFHSNCIIVCNIEHLSDGRSEQESAMHHAFKSHLRTHFRIKHLYIKDTSAACAVSAAPTLTTESNNRKRHHSPGFCAFWVFLFYKRRDGVELSAVVFGSPCLW